jgi:uncharacterized protein (DUF111 family)
LKDVPIYGGAVQGELCTPTGAALLRHFVSEFGPMPLMRVSATGHGAGRKDFPRANIVRAMLGESGLAPAGDADEVLELACNIDDMTAEDLAFAAESVRDVGALDVWMEPALMKKGRPGTIFLALCRPADHDAERRRLCQFAVASVAFDGSHCSLLIAHCPDPPASWPADAVSPLS